MHTCKFSAAVRLEWLLACPLAAKFNNIVQEFTQLGTCFNIKNNRVLPSLLAKCVCVWKNVIKHRRKTFHSEIGSFLLRTSILNKALIYTFPHINPYPANVENRVISN